MKPNWKTTLFGTGGILVCLLDIITNLVSGTPEKINWTVDVAGISAGIGLLFAKDSNVTGGSVKQ